MIFKRIIATDLQVTHTNLLLIVVDSMYPTCYRRLEVTPVNISPLEYANSTGDKPCHKIPLNALKRRRLENCFTEHPLEHEIKECGGASELTVSLSLLYVIIAGCVSQLCSFDSPLWLQIHVTLVVPSTKRRLLFYYKMQINQREMNNQRQLHLSIHNCTILQSKRNENDLIKLTSKRVELNSFFSVCKNLCKFFMFLFSFPRKYLMKYFAICVSSKINAAEDSTLHLASCIIDNTRRALIEKKKEIMHTRGDAHERARLALCTEQIFVRREPHVVTRNSKI